MDTTPSTLSQDNNSAVDEQHSVPRTLVLHLLPGVLILVFFVAVAPLVVRGLGFPPAMAVYLAIGFVLIPFELGYLIYQARKNGTSLGEIVLYRQPVPKGQFVLLVGALFVWGIIISPLVLPVDFFVKENLFSWLPWWLDISNGLAKGFARFSTRVLLITWAFGLIVNAVVFSLYHFFSPFQIVSRIIQFLPVVYAAWWKRSIYVSMASHVLGNVAGSVVTLLLILGVLGAG